MRLIEHFALCLGVASMAACGRGGNELKAQPPPEAVARFAPMSDTGYRVQWGVPGVPCNLKIGTSLPVSVVVTNVGDQVWRDIPSSDKGRGAVRLAYRWWKVSQLNVPAVDYNQARGDLSAPL